MPLDPSDRVRLAYEAAREYVLHDNKGGSWERSQAYGDFKKACYLAGIDFLEVLVEVRAEKAKARS